MYLQFTRVCLFCGCLSLLLVGCSSSGPELAEVSGTITLDGKPVPGATISFFPEDPQGSPSYGGTDYDGKYTMMFTRDKYGAMLGKHRVEIETQKIAADEAAEMRAEGQELPSYVAIPKKYRDQGALSAEVKPGDNLIDFALSSR